MLSSSKFLLRTTTEGISVKEFDERSRIIKVLEEFCGKEDIFCALMKAMSVREVK